MEALVHRLNELSLIPGTYDVAGRNWLPLISTCAQLHSHTDTHINRRTNKNRRVRMSTMKCSLLRMTWLSQGRTHTRCDYLHKTQTRADQQNFWHRCGRWSPGFTLYQGGIARTQSCLGRETHSLLRIWPLADFLCFNEWTHTYACMEDTNWI